jgi:hypothetical protein
MMQTIVSLLTHVSSLVVLVCSLMVINEMTAKTDHLIRIAYVLISTAAMTGVVAPFAASAWMPSPSCSFGMLGLAILLVAERRRSIISGNCRSNIHVIHHQQGRTG